MNLTINLKDFSKLALNFVKIVLQIFVIYVKEVHHNLTLDHLFMIAHVQKLIL